MDVYLLYGDKRAESVDLLSNRVYTGLQINADHTTQLADESENLMLKLKFLPYKIRTFLIRNGLSILYRSGFQAYRKYYLRQLENWNTSSHKQQQLDQLLTEWAKFVTTKYKGKGINSNAYLSEAEPFLAQFAKRSFQNRRLVGYTGSNPEEELLNNDSKDEDTHVQQYLASEQEDNDLNGKGMVIFFPGIPGSGKSALCAKLVADPGELGAARSIHFLMGDLVKGKYWPMLAKERQRRPVSTITVADKNAPNLEVWETIEDICERTSAIGVPVVPDSPGTEDNPFSLDILALFMFRVIQRVNHPGNLDKDSPNAGYILLMFYKLYSGKDRKEFEQTLRQRFGYLVKLSTLKSNSVIEHVLSEGLELFDLHSMKHKSSKRTSAKWSAWEKHLREVLNENASYFNDIQTPLEETFQSLRQQLVAIAKGAIPMVKSTREERSFKSIAYAFIALPVEDIINIIQQLAETSPEIQMYFLDKNFTMSSAHITLAHKRSHGVAAVAAYGEICGVEVPVRLTSFLFSDKTCALEAQIIENQQGIVSRNQWPHVTIWTAEGTKPKESNSLPEVVRSGHASRVDFMPIELSGVVELS
ncbi:hypothetical protein KP509_02G106200 [Ceratopteris richardii]|uniref:tRNA ligase phosphodiesterase domain-containing protein n=1 Tax=Ceratopteris richardii TaxID=49495 RepID=A0A8T2V9D8_CERRI|nr:hypothetical protein KP509_02G106200 [Ceratopteris richardii]